MDAMRPKEEDSDAEMLNETEQFIEIIDAVEKDRKESQSSEVATQSSGIEITVQRPSVSEVVVEDAFEEVIHNTEKKLDEDTISIFAGVGDDTKVDYQAGEKVSEYSLYKKVGDNENDIAGNYQIVDQGVIVSKRNEDNISVISFAVSVDGDNAALQSLTINDIKEASDNDDEEEDDDDDDGGDSVKTMTGGEDNNKII